MVAIEDKTTPTIIYPPPEVRNIVDKTAGFVARNGAEFEHRIKQNEVNNPKFNFLNPGDPYHAYYQHKVVQIREGKSEPAVEKGPKAPAESVQKKQSELLKAIQHKKDEVVVPKEPPPEFEFLADPPSISAFDLDVVKLTAQFVARNGRQFLTQLMNREQRNYQFDFLRPQHSLFQYFTKLLEQYTKVLLPPKDLQQKLDSEAGNKTKILEQVNWRVAWLQQEEAARRRQEEALERERISYAQVDWHNFVVVETVDYQPWEIGNFPPPTNPTEVGARVLIQRRAEETGAAPAAAAEDSDSDEDEGGEAGGADTQVQDMEEDSSEEEEDEEDEQQVEDPGRQRASGTATKMSVVANPPVQPPPIQAPTPGSVVVKKYDPKAAAAIRKKTEEDQYLISPLTGEKIPAAKAAEHMKVGLLDPKWVEERDKHITSKANEDIVFAPGQAIESSLKQLAERRTDIFGVGESAAEETAIGLKIGEEDQRLENEKVTWDGHSSSAEAAARAARANISLSDQIAQIHKQKGLIPEPIEPMVKTVVVAPPPVPVAAPPPPPQQQQQPPPPRPPMPMPPMMMSVPVRPMLVPQPLFIPTAPQGRPVFLPTPPGTMGEKKEQQQQQGGGPPAKRLKTEENLIPEGHFLARYSSPVTFKVSIPSLTDKPEWKCTGQAVTFTLPLTENIANLKQKIEHEVGMPPGKQKLQWESIFLKDGNTLAFYNVSPGTVLSLQLKERGGRKK